MKGIVLAGGTGSRLSPTTKVVSKQLLPLYDKPLVHYAIATLMASGIREMLIISSPEYLEAYKRLLGDGSALGISFEFAIQAEPNGIAEAFLIADDFILGEKSALILGDNFFHGVGLGRQLSEYSEVSGAQVLTYPVSRPQDYGVILFNEQGSPIQIDEKPLNPKSNMAITGLYFFDENVLSFANLVEPSRRGELEITSVLDQYLRQGSLKASQLTRGTLWMDTGTFEALHDASSYVRVLQERQGIRIACLEEVAWRKGWISNDQLISLANSAPEASLREYLAQLAPNE